MSEPRWKESLGLVLRHKDVASNAVAWSKAAERAGFGSIWISEDYFHPGAFALAGAAAAVTEHIVVGIGVVNPYTRHPALLAMEAAALADIAPGRVILGLGSSNRNAIEHQMAIPFRKPLSSLRECADVVRRLLAGERVSCQGQIFNLERVQLEKTPQTEVPVFLGVKGPAALAAASQIADGVLGAMLSTPAHVRRLRSAMGNNLSVICYVPVAVDPDRDRARQWVKSLIARYLGLLHGQVILQDAVFPAERTQIFRDAIMAGRDSTDQVSDEMIDAFAIAGSHGECREKLRLFAEAGADTLIAMIPKEAGMEEQIRSVGKLSPEWKKLRFG